MVADRVRTWASRPTLTATWPACTASSSHSCRPTSCTAAPSPTSRVTEVRVGRRAAVLQHDGGLGERADLDHDVAEDVWAGAGAGQGDHHGLVELGLGRHLDQDRTFGVGHREGGDPVDRRRATERDGLFGGDLAGGHLGGRLDLPVEVAAGLLLRRRAAAEPLQRGEPPDLLQAGGPGVVGQVVRRDRVQVRGDRLDRRRHIRGLGEACGYLRTQLLFLEALRQAQGT